MNDNRPRIRPPRFENQYPHLPRDISTTHMRPMRPPTSGMAGPSGPSNGHYNGQFGHSQAAALASGMPKVESAGGASSKAADKRAVRKKRQRKFVCDKCNFGFYTNSDLQKVCSFSFFRHFFYAHLLTWLMFAAYQFRASASSAFQVPDVRQEVWRAIQRDETVSFNE